MKYIFILLFTAFIGVTAKAQSDTATKQMEEMPLLVKPLASDRPGQTFNALTLSKGVWQIQAGVSWGRLLNNPKGLDYNVLSMPIDLRYGITEKLEVSFSPAPVFANNVGTESGIEYNLSQFSAAVRYQLFADKPFGHLSVHGAYQLVNYERGEETGSNGSLKLLYALPLGDLFTFSTNLGYSVSSYSSNEFTYTANAVFNIMPRFGMFVEAFGNVQVDAAAANGSGFDAGVFYLVNSNFQLDAAYALTENDALQDYYTSVGLTYRF